LATIDHPVRLAANRKLTATGQFFARGFRRAGRTRTVRRRRTKSGMLDLARNLNGSERRGRDGL
jgi:hypothetical protein